MHFSGIVDQTPPAGGENKLWMNEIVNVPHRVPAPVFVPLIYEIHLHLIICECVC